MQVFTACLNNFIIVLLNRDESFTSFLLEHLRRDFSSLADRSRQTDEVAIVPSALQFSRPQFHCGYSDIADYSHRR